MLTLAQIKEKAENRMTVAEAKAFEKEVGLTLDEFFALANLNARYRALAEILLSDCFEYEDWRKSIFGVYNSIHNLIKYEYKCRGRIVIEL